MRWAFSMSVISTAGWLTMRGAGLNDGVRLAVKPNW